MSNKTSAKLNMPVDAITNKIVVNDSYSFVSLV